MGGKMRSKIKRTAIWAALAAVVLSVFILAEYFNIGLGFAAGKLAVTVQNLAHLSKCLNSSQYQLDVRNVCLVGFLVLLTFWRALLIRKARF